MTDERRLKRKLAGLVLATIVIAITTSVPFRTLVTLPDAIRISSGQEHVFGLDLPLVRAHCDQQGFLATEGWPLVIKPAAAGQYTVEFRLFGLIPLRRVAVEVVPPIYVVPGGHSIGVLLHSHGVIVSSVSTVTDQQGRVFRPAKDAGLVAGDLILLVDGQPVRSDEQLAELVHRAGVARGAVELEVQKRDGRVIRRTVTPVRCGTTDRFRIGIWVRDTAAGVGTLTFYEPESGLFAALGHVVTDHDTGQPVNIVAGRVVRSTVTGVEAGRRGHPGEIIGAFVEETDLMGSIVKNSQVGIVGMLDTPISNPYFPKPIPVAMSREVRTGPVEILTVVEGRNIKKFSAEIVEIRRDPLPYGRLVIRVTDEELIKRTGGIVQGMSGSPMVQDGKLVGAVTHVLVSDPTRGYGVSAEWMVIEAGLDKIMRRVGALGSPALLLSKLVV